MLAVDVLPAKLTVPAVTLSRPTVFVAAALPRATLICPYEVAVPVPDTSMTPIVPVARAPTSNCPAVRVPPDRA